MAKLTSCFLSVVSIKSVPRLMKDGMIIPGGELCPRLGTQANISYSRWMTHLPPAQINCIPGIGYYLQPWLIISMERHMGDELKDQKWKKYCPHFYSRKKS